MLRRLAALALIPLSIVPVVASLPQVEDEYDEFAGRFLNREALPAPEVRLDRGYAPVQVPRGTVPVLLYHGIEERGSSYSIARDEFARQMEMLDRAGFRTIGIDTYTRWLHGKRVRLPRRPLLLTFDDGRLDSFRGADAVLQQHGFRAVMFAIAGHAKEEGSFYSTWDELRAMARSGRWDVQLHAARGHTQVPLDGRGRSGPFYANRIWQAGKLESFAAARDRIIGDLTDAELEFRRYLPGFRRFAFAVPFGDFGQLRTNDGRIPRMLRPWMAHEFGVTFVQAADAPFSRPGGATEIVRRFEVTRSTSTDDLHRWLSRYRSRDTRRR